MRGGFDVLALVLLASRPAGAAPAEPAPLVSGPASPAAAFEETLAQAAASRPAEEFTAPADTPDGFRSLLASRGCPARKITNLQAWELYRGSPRAALPARSAAPSVAVLPSVGSASAPSGPNFDGTKAVTGGPDPVAPAGSDAQAPKKEENLWQGLRILGVELGGGRDPLKQDNEPYLRKGIPQLLDWDIRARVDIEGLGARAMYRHPLNLRSFSVGFLKYLDVPAVLGLDSLRDKAYGLVGAAPEKPTGGFEASASGAINQYLGGATTFDWKDADWRDRVTNYWLVKSEAGYSPLGENPGKPWNYTLLLTGNYEDIAVSEGAYSAEKKGFGYSAGVAFQEALNRLSIPVLQPHPSAASNFLLDRFRARLDAGPIDVTGAGARLAAEVTVLVLRHLELSGGAQFTFYPSPDWRDPQAKYVDPAAIVGMGLRY